MIKTYKYLLIFIVTSSCTSLFQKDIIAFNNTKGKEVLRFINYLKKVPALDTTYKMEYRIKSPEIYFYYLDSAGNKGNFFYPGITISKSLIDFFFDIGLSVIYREKHPDHFDIQISYFRNKQKDINMIVFDSTDSLKNNKYIKQILTNDDKLLFVDKNVYYYQSTWHW